MEHPILRGLLGLVLVAGPLPSHAQDRPTIIFPPPAAEIEGEIEQITLAPIFAESFVCSDHFEGQLPYAGDALGSDCLVQGIEEGGPGFYRLYRSDGRTNEDWYTFGKDVLAPVAGEVVGVNDNAVVNEPGTLGRPPASMVQLRTQAGEIVLLAHVTDIRVKIGDAVTVGDKLAVVGNNGFARTPHIHIGAWREADDTPLQLRWDLSAPDEDGEPRDTVLVP